MATTIDLVMAVLFLVAILRGWHIGLAVRAGHLAAMIAAGVLAHAAANILKTGVGRQWVLPWMEGQAGLPVKGLEQGIEMAADHVAYYLLFSLIFTAALIVFYQLVRVLKLVDRIPVVGTLNKLGGALLGFLVEFLFFLILGMVLFGLIPADAWNRIGLTREAIEGSYLLRAFVPQ